MIKAVFFDIDGTLVSFETHRVPDETTAALMELKRRGVKIFIATGRSGLLMKQVGTIDPDMFDGVITFNGQYCRVGGEVIWSHRIPEEDVFAAINYLDANPIPCMFEGPGFVAINTHNDIARRAAELLGMTLVPPGDLHAIQDRDTVQLIFFGDDAQEHEFMKVVPSCVATRWHPDFSDIIPRGGGKHIGMEKIMERFGFTREECMAFGDGGNDISMLRYAGTGIAMANASQEVKDAADYITDGVDELGIPNALRHFGLI